MLATRQLHARSDLRQTIENKAIDESSIAKLFEFKPFEYEHTSQRNPPNSVSVQNIQVMNGPAQGLQQHDCKA